MRELGKQQQAMLPHLLTGLRFLRQELQYHRANELGSEFDVPLLRTDSARLAMLISNAGWAEEPVVREWLEDACNDPLPEVRNSIVDVVN